MRNRAALLVAGLTAITCVVSAASASAAVQTKEVQYEAGGAPMHGFLAWNDAAKGKRPGVLLVHEWWGLNQNARNQAKRLAEAGYVAFALDMFGGGRSTTHPTEAQLFVAEATKDPAAMDARFKAGLQQLKQDPHVDAQHIAAIGYCFGGAVVLSEARSGAPLDAVVSLHGAMPQPASVQKGAVKAKVLILAGGSDPMVPQSAISTFVNSLKEAGADVRLVTYPGVEHSFTNPDADKAGVPGLKYNAQADKESFTEMLNLFKQIWHT